MSNKPSKTKSPDKFNRNVNDGPDVEHMEKFRYIRTVIYSREFTALDHNIAFRILERYGRHGINNARCSLRFLETGTGAGRPSVIASLRRLVKSGALKVARPGAGTRPTEYVPNFEFSDEISSGIADDTSSGSVDNTTSSGNADDTSSGIARPTSNPPSGMAEATESHLLKATYRGTDVSEEIVSDALPGGLTAPDSVTPIPRKFKIEVSDYDTDDDGTVALFLEFSPVLGGDWESLFLNLELGSLYSELLDGSPETEFSHFWTALQFMGHPEQASDLAGHTFWATGAGDDFVFHTEAEALDLMDGGPAGEASAIDKTPLPDWLLHEPEPLPDIRGQTRWVPDENAPWRRHHPTT